MRRFILYRDVDVSGYSGTGVVVEGIQFSDGTVAMRWRSEEATTVIAENIDKIVKIHGHDGATRLVWVDAIPFADWEMEKLGSWAREREKYWQPALPGLEESA